MSVETLPSATDPAGNLTGDAERSLIYNVFNLPRQIDAPTTSQRMTYLGGTVHSRTNQDDETHYYLDGLEVINDELASYHFSDGRLAFRDGEPHFQYRITDHLGNTVVLFEDKNDDGLIVDRPEDAATTEVLQRQLYYPFGMELRGTSPVRPAVAQLYGYNGKEKVGGTGLLDYGARFYDPVVGRWGQVDPIAGDMSEWSPYNYVYGNPIKLIDPLGLSPSEPPVNGLSFFSDDTGEYYWNYKNNNYDRFFRLESGNLYPFGTYRANKFREPVGEYTINFNSTGEQASGDFNPDHTIESLSGFTMMMYSSEEIHWKDVSDPSKYPEVKIFSSDKMEGAITLGNMIFLNSALDSKNLRDHEYGHYLDFKHHFKFNKSKYIDRVGIPSFFSAINSNLSSHEHYRSESERRANILGGAWGKNKTLQNRGK